MELFIYIYLAAISIFAVIITALDKRRAVHRDWRVKESTLLLVSALGGTGRFRKWRVMLAAAGVVLIILLQAGAAFAVWRVFYG